MLIVICLFGKEGIGKKEFAKAFAKKILCLGDIEEKACKSFIEFDSKNNPDFLILEPENNVIKIEQIRTLMAKSIEKPIIGKRKVYIIDEADFMTREAQNSLLKTLEEPPEYLVIILIVKNESQILTTIKSRCTKIAFKPIEDNILKKYLEQKYSFNNLDEDRIKSFDGSIGIALKWKEKEELYKQIEDFFYTIEIKDKIELLNNQNPIYKNKDDIMDILTYMNTLFLKKIKHEGENHELIAKNIECIEILENTKKRLNSNGNFDMCIDSMLLHLHDTLFDKE